MPNHFHIMVYIREIEIDIMSIGVVKNNTDAKEVKRRTINQSIGIMLRSYSQAVNRQQNYSGKLIR
jgi:putative transposase